MSRQNQSSQNASINWAELFHGRTTAPIILLASLIITFIAWKVSSDYAERRAQERFIFQTDEAQDAISRRFVSYEQVLRSGLGLFKASDSVDRTEWKSFINTLEIEKYFPGTLGVGFSIVVPENAIPAHEATIRSEGFPNYSHHPDGTRDLYTAIIYLEPFNERNRRAFGYDMYSEPTRREAMMRARDTGEIALSGKVTLVQETSKDVQAGFLVYIPLYDRPVNTIDERRQALNGFVYSALRVGDLMNGILGVGIPEVDFEIYDGNEIGNNTLLYRSRQPDDSQADRQVSTYSVTRKLPIGGHTWTIQYHSNETFSQQTSSNLPNIVATGGLIIDVLLFIVIMNLSRLHKSAQKLAEEQTRKLSVQEVKFKAITDTANDGIISTDKDGRITYFNRAAQEIFGYSSESVESRNISMLFSEPWRANVGAFFENNEATDNLRSAKQPLEVEGLTATNEIIPIELSLACLRNDNLYQYTVILRDITERKRVETMKSEFLSTVSHELRTPITAISGSLSLIENGIAGEISANAMSLVSTAHRNSTRLINLVNEILDTEKLASGKMQFEFNQCNTGELVKNAVDINQHFATQYGNTIIIEKLDEILVTVDSNRFNQVMTNLISNAVKFSDPGNTIKVGVTKTAGNARFYVTDNGIGIPDEFRSAIFNRFSQADGTDAKKYGGTGLGLSIVKYIIDRFGGHIDFESTPNQGTTFYFELPEYAEIPAASSLAQC